MDLCDLKNDDNLYCVNENEVSTLKEQLLDKLKRYGFEGFVHTTELENFRKIIECGYLHPRKTLVEGEMRFTDRAEAEVLRKTDDYIQRCSRFYYYYKTPTNYMAKYKNPVALVFDEELIFLKKGVFFSPENACYNHWTNNVAKALDFDWEGVFERSRHALSKYYKQLPYEECAKKINKIRNAEFLVKDKRMPFCHRWKYRQKSTSQVTITTVLTLISLVNPDKNKVYSCRKTASLS